MPISLLVSNYLRSNGSVLPRNAQYQQRLALEAREQLQKEGLPTRVVSLPCTELFEEQSQDYRDEVLPPSITARLAIEAGVRQGWDRWVGFKGDVICLDRFGASAPGEVAMKNLGFNVQNVLIQARALL